MGQGSAVLIEGGAWDRQIVAGTGRPGCEADARCPVFWGVGDELGQALPLLPLLEALRVRELPDSPRRNTIVRLLRGELAADRGADVSAAVAEQLLTLIAEECAAQPAILVIDDLQWADRATVTLWARLARSVHQMPLLLAGMMRPVPQREDAGTAAGGRTGGPAPAPQAPRQGGGRTGNGPGRRRTWQ